MNRRTWLLFIALSIVWGLPYFFIKIALNDVSPAGIALGRVALGALLLIGFIPWADWKALRGRLLAIGAVAFTDIALPFYLIANGERTVSSTVTGMILAAIPIVVALLAFAIDSAERASRRQVAGLLVGVAGVAVLLGNSATHGRSELGGIAMIAGATISYSFGVLMIKRWLQNVPMLATTAAMLVAATFMLAPPALVSLPRHLPHVPALLAIVVLGAVCTAAAYVMYFALIARAGAVRASVVTYLNPAFAAILGVAVLHESLRASAIAGLGLIIAGSWFSTGYARPAPPAQAFGQ